MNYQYLLSLLLTVSIFNVQATEIKFEPVNDINFVADFYSSGDKSKFGVLVLGGSGGGKPKHLANKIAALGYSVLSLAYFKEDGLPKELEMIALEYFDTPKQWLIDNKETRNDGLIVVGWSKGAELSLLLSSRDKQYKGVVGIAPSSVIWAGILKDWSKVPSSSWSENSKPHSFVPFATNIEFKGLTDLYEQSLKNTNAVNKASIKVELIKSPILLLTGGLDEIWPANKMAIVVCDKVNLSNKKETCKHVNYPDAGHLLDEEFVIGGTKGSNAEANKSSMEQIKQLLERVN
jgi:esterase/lipase